MAEQVIQKIKAKILSVDEIVKRVTNWKANNQKVVFTNGCFDILHRGHVEYLSAASQLGDKLIIGLNSDSSVRQLKGDDRPVNDENARAIILAAMQFVDAVVFFSDETPYHLINAVQPDFLVKGGDYRAEEIVGYDIITQSGGQVVTIDLVEGFSTTKIINRMAGSS